MRTDSSSNTVKPAMRPSGALAPSNGDRNAWRWYTGNSERGTYAFLAGDQEPVGVCTPAFSYTGPSNTQFGIGTLASARPASMSSFTQSAICRQPAACQDSNGPRFQPKPQRNARSTS